jgi:hypothetical protein
MLKSAVLATLVAVGAPAATLTLSAQAGSGIAGTSISFNAVAGGLRTDRAITIGDDNTCTKIDGASECLSTTLANLQNVRACGCVRMSHTHVANSCRLPAPSSRPSAPSTLIAPLRMQVNK